MIKINSVYMHIPFCLRKCNYCDFVSRPLAGCERDLVDYPQLISAELDLYREQVDLNALQTLYFGGGTPSLLPPDAVAELIALFPSAAEVTLEANPETIDPARLAAFRQAGVNRLSVGVQSFDDMLLQAMGRGHSAAQAVEAIKQARLAGFDNISLDLIYGLPGQTTTQWRQDLERALAQQTQHISLYGLTLHDGTVWGEQAQRGELTAADEDTSADMLELAMEMLPAAGYRQYEISNFACPGWESRHNIAYWRRENYLGLGAAAASCLLNRRFVNLSDVSEYAAAVRSGRCPLTEREDLDIEQVLAEAIFLGLRLAEGINFAAYAQQYGVDPRRRYKRQIKRMQGLGLLSVDDERMMLTSRGLLLGNEVFTEFI